MEAFSDRLYGGTDVGQYNTLVPKVAMVASRLHNGSERRSLERVHVETKITSRHVWPQIHYRELRTDTVSMCALQCTRMMNRGVLEKENGFVRRRLHCQ